MTMDRTRTGTPPPSSFSLGFAGSALLARCAARRRAEEALVLVSVLVLHRGPAAARLGRRARRNHCLSAGLGGATRARPRSHPAKHVHKVQQHLHRANRLAKEAAVHTKLAATRARQLAAAKGGVVGSYVATPTGAALFAGLPPEIMLTEAQKKRDERTLRSITPEGGMPRDTRLDMRVSSATPVHRR